TCMLGRPYALEGTIVRGDQLGRKLGFPTANLSPQRQLLPRHGVYAGWDWLDETGGSHAAPLLRLPDAAIPMVMNLGVRPTLLGTPALRVEPHLLAGTYATDGLYGLKATFYPTVRLRDEQRFADVAALQQQITRDVA